MSLRGIMELVHINDLGEVGRNKMLNRVKKEDTSEEVDRLSDLSDHIVEHILCFLDTKYAVQTSVLSKRWRNLWTGVPVLDFDSDCFAQLVPFKKFVRNALRVREGDSIVGTFRFFYRGYDEHLMTRLINYVISHNVSHLDIWIGGEYNPFPPLPWKLLEYEALETLELKGFGFIQSFSFSILTALFLDHCKFTFYDASDSDCFDLLSCCPNLIHLCLSSCLFNRLRVLKISGPQLLSLSLSDLSDDRDIGYCELEISAPGLTYFSCAKPDGIAFSVIDLPSLQHTDMDLPLLPMPLVNIFGGISSAQSLSLSPHTIEALDEALGLEFQFTPFSRLKSWNLTEDPDDGSFLIPTKVSSYLSSQLS